ncbi:MAG: putative baseplate assembly protein [Hydrocarboniphaga sp.]|uniref:putative baseplate assembly protein n=1 Tax=Hydrocarboniphaga sp. TaxID=2033016 RepID=UPI00261795CC|nr:putative baseplate assembly protein [Hydrocarboniphaga sp.]MDB5970556.1 putative baseplate assembly protein [Hydrocarboniphaga sp.]
MIYRCCDALRRNLVAAHPTLNGIDYLEVIDRELPEFDALRQRTLLVHCLKPLPAAFSAGNVELLGGERVRNIEVQWASPASPLPAQLSASGEAATRALVQALPDAASTLLVRTALAGDFSVYTLRLVNSPLDDDPPADFDPRMREIDFSFKVECPSDFDCAPQSLCPPADADAPDIDYLAKDYSSFRRLILDRMAQLVPQWQQSSVADTGIAVAELLAYAADQLSYQQDAIATEAYLGTARRRVSLRRHALLVDYPMHDGCNARAWLQLQVEAASALLPLAGTQFLTRLPGFDTGIAVDSPQFDAAMQLAPQVFEPLLDSRFAPDYRQPLYAAHNRMSFYTWSDQRCCMPQGATQATLKGAYPDLKAGDALLFEELVGPNTGKAGDADPAHRHVVKLTRVLPTAPATLSDPLTGEPITEIEWALADALPFALCISGVTDAEHGAQHLDDISVARGNLLLVDHGRTINREALGTVPQPTLYAIPDCSADRCDPPARIAIPPRYRPQLAYAPLTQAANPLGAAAGPFASAAQVFDWSMDQVLPQIALDSVLGTRNTRWQAQRHLLNSAGDASEFVVEIDDDGAAALRFGDDEHGERPDSGTAFTAAYRIGNGAAGNVGADRIVHVVAQPGDLAQLLSVRNPLAAAGGVDPESADSVRRNAPQAFRTQQRAVTTDDYAAVTERNVQVQRAAATLRWTGSWHTVFITVDPLAGVDSAALKNQLLPFVDRYRMAGHDLEFNDPRYVPLEVGLHVCVKDDYFRSDVKQSLLQFLGNRRLADGRLGLFHPDNFTFGQTVYLSPLYAAAHQVPGVASAQVTKFQRQGTGDPSYLLNGELPLNRLEIARLDNDPNFPERGVLRLDIHGGK